MRDAGGEAGRAARRRRRQPSRRRCRVEFTLGEEEFAELRAAAGAAGLALGAYAARATLGAVRGDGGRGGGGGRQLRDAMTALSRYESQVRKIGTNLNQAVAKLNATGQSDRDLPRYAAAAVRIADDVGEAAEQVRRAALR